MAKLSDFLGALSSSISDARVYSDLQSVQIAKEFLDENNPDREILKHFSVPRMRIDKVEFSIPVSVEKMDEEETSSLQISDRENFKKKTEEQVLNTLKVSRLSEKASRKLKTDIANHMNVLEAKMKVTDAKCCLEEFSKDIASKTLEQAPAIYKEQDKAKPSAAQLRKMQATMTNELQSSLEKEIVTKKDKNILDSVDVIVEADKLREIKPENIITIKMTVSEQGMEWVNEEDQDGEVVSKLLPE